MTLRRVGVAGASLLWGLVLASPAFATQPGKCTLLSEIAALGSTGGGYNEILSTSPARVCHVEFLATQDDGWAQVYDAASVTQTAANIAE